MLSLDSRFVGNVYVIECRGSIVLGPEGESMQAALELGAREFSRIVLNVAKVDRLDSSGLGLLVRYAANLRKRGGDLRLAEPPPIITSLLELTKLTGLLQSNSTEAEAILSFLNQPSTQPAHAKTGPRVLVVDQSADLCAFVRTVLLHHDFDVQSTSLVRDARILLQVAKVDYILIGPGSTRLPAETVSSSLQAAAAQAKILKLDPDFKDRDAHEATGILLQMFGVSSD